ncbi:MAG: hypothetical protein NUV45_13065 [Tepidanaerobacteraceae bacterium]|jgi:hypothetical protein|nr:hypothetical protein [Tepidanaerobacteraceae bacterium]
MDQRKYIKYILIGLLTIYLMFLLSYGIADVLFSLRNPHIVINSLSTIKTALYILGGIIISCTFAIIDTLHSIFGNKNSNTK